MGLGPPIIALYKQLKYLGMFDGIDSVMEMGAQNVWCPRPNLVNDLFAAFEKPPAPADMLERFASWKGSAKELYTALGFEFNCVDVDPSFDSLRLDLNFDECPPDHVGKYGLVTNHGTSEHLLNQYNFFKVMHDLARPGGVMIHAVPFTVHLEHGFFNYQPNFFEALARYNGYRLHGLFVGPDWQLTSLIPWEPQLLDFLVLNGKTTHLLVAVLQKVHDKKFCVPFQGVYEDMVPEEVIGRYDLVVDGELYDGKRVRHITEEKVIADKVAQETLVLRNEYNALNGRYWDLATKHNVAETRIQNELEPLKQELASSLIRGQALGEKVDTLLQKIEALEMANGKPTVLDDFKGPDIARELSKRIRRRLNPFK